MSQTAKTARRLLLASDHGADPAARAAGTHAPRASDIFNEFDAGKRMTLPTRRHEHENEQDMMIFVVQDVNPRGLSAKLKGFVRARSWRQDLMPIAVSP